MPLMQKIQNALATLLPIEKHRQSIPAQWCGLWVDTSGKQLVLQQHSGHYAVTVADNTGTPFCIHLLGDATKNTTELLGRLATDTKGIPMLQVEAGENGIGPTYNLYFVAVEHDGTLRLAHNSDDISSVHIIPDVGMGLYHDWEDDLGVPWAFPLHSFTKRG